MQSDFFGMEMPLPQPRMHYPPVEPEILTHGYPKERFGERIARLVNTVSLSLTARNEDGLLIGVLFGLTDFAYWLYVTDLGVDRDYTHRGIGGQLMRTAHELAGGEKDIAVYLIVNENAVPFYEKLGMKKADDVMQYSHVEWTDFTVE